MAGISRIWRNRILRFGVPIIALGVAPAVVIFAIVNALWLRPSIPDSDRVVVILRESRPRDGSRFSSRALAELRNNIRGVETMAGQAVTRDIYAGLLPRVMFDRAGRPVEALGVTAEYFTVVGVRLLGRDFTDSDDRYGAEPAVIVSDRLWSRAFGRAPDAIGSILPASPRPLRVVGVAPPGFHGALRGENVDLWLPHNLLPALAGVSLADNPEGSFPLVALARLRPGATTLAVQQELLSQKRSAKDIAVVPIDRMFGAPDLPVVVIREGRVVSIAAATALFVVAATCATLMALVLLHAEERRREQAIRIAVGAGSAHLVGRLSLELGLLIVAGSGGALWLAALAFRALPTLSLPGGVDLSRLQLTIDWSVVGAAVTMVSLAAFTGASLTLARMAKAVGAQGSPVRPRSRLEAPILAVNFAVTTVVLIVGGLFLRSVVFGYTRAPGFDEDRTLFLTVETMFQFDQGRFGQDLDARARHTTVAAHDAIEAIRAIPGVQEVALGEPPIGPLAELGVSQVDSVRAGGGTMELQSGWQSVGSGYFDVLGAPLVVGEARGRGIVVTPAVAEQLWPGQSPVGQSFASSYVRGEVVGVVDLAYGSLRIGQAPAYFTLDMDARLPSTLRNTGRLRLAIRAADPDAVRDAVRRAANEAFPFAVLVTTVSGAELVAADLGQQRLGAWLFAGFGTIALCLALGSVFGLVRHAVTLRRREFAILAALGASPAAIVRKAVVMGVGPVAAGGIAGAAAAAIIAPLVESALLGVTASDLVTYSTVIVLVIVAATTAAVVGARGLRRLPIAEILRAE